MKGRKKEKKKERNKKRIQERKIFISQKEEVISSSLHSSIKMANMHLHERQIIKNRIIRESIFDLEKEEEKALALAFLIDCFSSI